MTRARNQQISLQDTPYYHCISRCVRRAYLCGEDPVSGENFDHRKRWLVQRMKQLADVFAVDICAYAVMSNHYHLVLCVDQDAATAWDDEEVIRRWTRLFPRNALLIKTLHANHTSSAARHELQQTLALWRERLCDISWYMRCLNESIARRANREDDCTGRFWEGRFKSQALLDERALVTCMAYVDLNPVRAGMTDTLETSDFTSIQERLIQQARQAKRRSYRQQRLLNRRGAAHLVGRGNRFQARLKPLASANGSTPALPVERRSYFELLEVTCKALGAYQAGSRQFDTEFELKPGLSLPGGMSARGWLESVTAFHKHYATAAGSESALEQYQRSRIERGNLLKHGDKWIRGRPAARLLFGG